MLAEVPDWIWNGEELPVPVENIADSCFGLLIRDVEDMTIAPGAPELREGQSLSGLLLAGPGEIWVNAEEARQWPGRRRFTIGHELGHWVMHRAPGQQSLFCRHAEVDEQEGEPEHDRASEIEREANAFAAAFTMPAHLIREHYERLAPRARLPRAPLQALQLVRSGDGAPTSRGDLILQAANDPPKRAVRGEAGTEAPAHG